MYIRRYNFLYARKKSVAFTAPIFTKLTNFEQYYTENSCTEFHPDRSLYET